MTPCDIVLVTWFRPEITQTAIDTLIRNTDRKQYRLIVVDNGSPAKMQDMLVKYWENDLIDELVLNDENKGLEPARNQGLELVESEYFVCMDSDCLAYPREDGKTWLERLYDLIKANPEYAAISCRTQVMIGTGNIFEEADENGDELVTFPHPGGSFRIMLTDAVRRVGGWRDDSVGRGAEERYIGGRLDELGYKSAFSAKIKTLHLFGDRTKHTDRWGYSDRWTPDQTGHSDIWHPALANGDDPEEVAFYTGGGDVRPSDQQ